MARQRKPRNRTQPESRLDVPVPQLIARKRDGGELTEDEIQGLIDGFVRGEVADYQMTALAMAVCFQGMTARETAALTLAMRDSGTVLDLSKIAGSKIDKHSTGGVGDKVSLCLAPMVAACGVRVPMISGRGLGHTGGTLDKLEAVPGFSVDLGAQDFVRHVRDVGCALGGQTADLAPADKRLYALRDVTATVESVPLITASILSKKLAEGIDGLVLDVKTGRGAFMKTPDEARELARSLVRVARRAGTRVTAVMTDMNAPLGRTVGNALETAEAFDVLNGGGPEDLLECTYALGAEMLRLGGVEHRAPAARRRLREVVDSGEARRTMEAIVRAQGGDPGTVGDPSRLPQASAVAPVRAEQDGWVASVDALEIGLCSMGLGAGRTRADQAIDPSAGVVLAKKPGEQVTANEPLAHLHAADRKTTRAWADRARQAFKLRRTRPRRNPLVLDTIRG